MSGVVRADEVVTPVAGAWAGGWADDYDALSLLICATATGEGCLQVNHEGPEPSCGPAGATALDPAFTGRYLRVVDQRYGSGTAFAGVGHPLYYAVPSVAASPTVSVATVGEIAPAPKSSSTPCGPPPIFSAEISASGSAEVLCQYIGCRATLLVRRRGRKALSERQVPPDRLATAVPRPARLLKRLGPGRARVIVFANGRVIAHRFIGLRSPVKKK